MPEQLMAQELRQMQQQEPEAYELLARCPDAATQRVVKLIDQCAPAKTPILVTGRTGSGKELVARAIHRKSTRRDRDMVLVNCASLPPNLVLSELFGHERGSFTGAVARREGRFEMANGSTAFLDEIGELPPEVQAQLLRILEDGTFSRLGGNELLRSDFRLIVATNRDLRAMVARGAFREDLYFRLNVFEVAVPPLCKRPADVPYLAQYFMEKFAHENNKGSVTLGLEAVNALQSYNWPGNVRELKHVMERATILLNGDKVVQPHHLRLDDRGVPRQDSPLEALADEFVACVEGVTLDEMMWSVEHAVIEAALRQHGGNHEEAAEQLGLTRHSLRYRMRREGTEAL